MQRSVDGQERSPLLHPFAALDLVKKESTGRPSVNFLEDVPHEVWEMKDNPASFVAAGSDCGELVHSRGILQSPLN